MSPFCVANAGAALCHDFDSADVVFPMPWDSVQLQSGTITIDSLDAASPPMSLVSSVPGGAPNNNRNYLTKAYEPKSSLRVAADLLVEATSTSGFAELLKITLSPAPAGYREYLCALNTTPGGMINLELYANDETGMSMFPWAAVETRFDTWNRVELEMVLVPTPTCILYDATGAQLAAIEGMPVTSLGQAVQIGLVDVFSASGTIVSTWQARHDNVLVTTEP